MKKLIILFVVFLASFLLYAQQEPSVKFYLLDGSSRQFRILEIDKISFSSFNQNYLMKLYYQRANTIILGISTIDSLNFSIDSNRINVLNVFALGSHKTYNLFEIDSITFLPVEINQ
ncbi:MAG: hypothetical protein WCT77_04875, partial [Bacteroidota bacterium]